MDRISKNKLRSLLFTIINATPSVLIYVDRSGRIVFWNEKARALSGVECDAARGRELAEVLPFVQPSAKVIQRAMESGQVQKECRKTEIGDGVTRDFEIAVYPHIVKDDDGESGAVICADALPQGKSSGESTRNTMGSVQRTGVTSHIAHEINNHLAGVLQNIQVIKHRLVGDLPKNRMHAEACDTTLEAIKAYVDKRDIVPMIEAIVDSASQAAKTVTNELRIDRPNDVK